MTYRQLLERLKGLYKNRLDDDVMVLLMKTSEVVAIVDFVHSWKSSQADTPIGKVFGIDLVNGVLDKGHPFLRVDVK